MAAIDETFAKFAILTAEHVQQVELARKLEAKLGTPEQQATIKRYTLYISACVFYNTIFGAWAVMMLWNWFIAPALEIHALSFFAALGVGWALRALHNLIFDVQSTEWATAAEGIEKLRQGIIHALVSPLLAVGIGWVIHWLQLRFGG